MALRKKVVIVTDKGIKVKPKFFPTLHSKRKNVIAYPNFDAMKDVDPKFWTKDEKTGQLREMSRPEKLKRIEYLNKVGSDDGTPEWIWLVVFSALTAMIYYGYQYRAWEWVGKWL